MPRTADAVPKRSRSDASRQHYSGVMPRETLARLRSLAERDRRSLNAQLLWIVERYLASQEQVGEVA